MNQHHIESLRGALDLSSVGVIQKHVRSAKDRNMTSGAARQLLGGFGLTRDLALMPISLLSGGQKARLCMASAVIGNPHLLIMDEPTNHLDVSSREALTDGLRAFNGGILLVSHDVHFLKQVCNELWIVREGGVRVVKGNFSEALDTHCADCVEGGRQSTKKRETARRHRARGRFD